MPKARRKKYYTRTLGRFSGVFKLILIVFVVIVVLTGSLFVIFKTDIFKIAEVYVSGAKSFVSDVDLKELAEESALGRVSLFINKGDLREKLLRNFRGAKSISVKVQFPKTLVLEVLERNPLALVINESSPDYFIVDSEGYVLGVVDESKTNLPEIRYEGDITVGEFINPDLVPVYLDLMKGLDENQVQAASISFHPRYVRMYLKDGIEVLIGNDKNKTEALGIVKGIIRQESMEEETLSKIDLRFDKVSVQ